MGSSKNSRMTLITVGVTPTLLMVAREERDHFYIEMVSGTDLKVGPATTEIIKPLVSEGDSIADKGYLGYMYATVSTGTGQVIVWEIDKC